MSGQVVKSRLGLFWEEGYKKELVSELEELVQKMKKADTSSLVSLVPKAVTILVKLYDWATGGEQDDYEVLAELIAEVVQKHLKLDKDEIEALIEELEHKLK